MPLPPPARNAPMEMRQLVQVLESHRDELFRIQSVCQRREGNYVHVRFEPARSVVFVLWQVQSSAEGGADYDPETYVTREIVDCREDRIIDRTVVLDGLNDYYAWVIPVERRLDTEIVYDGEEDRPDYAMFMSVG